MESINPWTVEVWESEKLVEHSVTDLKSVAVGRRATVLHNYRNGKMYAVLKNGQFGMSPASEVQCQVNKLTKDRGSKMTLSEWMVFLKQTIAKKEGNIAKKASKASKKRKREDNPFDIGNVSDDVSDDVSDAEG